MSGTKRVRTPAVRAFGRPLRRPLAGQNCLYNRQSTIVRPFPQRSVVGRGLFNRKKRKRAMKELLEKIKEGVRREIGRVGCDGVTTIYVESDGTVWSDWQVSRNSWVEFPGDPDPPLKLLICIFNFIFAQKLMLHYCQDLMNALNILC